MSQRLTLELDDQVFAAIQQQAETIGIPLESLAATLLAQNFSQYVPFALSGNEKSGAEKADAEKESRRASFERHFGAIDLGAAINLDNDSIDADLSKEYASTHEEG